MKKRGTKTTTTNNNSVRLSSESSPQSTSASTVVQRKRSLKLKKQENNEITSHFLSDGKATALSSFHHDGHGSSDVFIVSPPNTSSTVSSSSFTSNSSSPPSSSKLCLDNTSSKSKIQRDSPVTTATKTMNGKSKSAIINYNDDRQKNDGCPAHDKETKLNKNVNTTNGNNDNNDCLKWKQQTTELRKTASSLNSQLNATLVEKNELSRQFWNLNEDYKELKCEIEIMAKERSEAILKGDKLERSLKASKETVQTIKGEMNKLTTDHETALRVAVETRESKLKKEYDERIGGLEEVVEETRVEIAAMEEEKQTWMNRLDDDRRRFEEERSMLKQTIQDKTTQKEEWDAKIAKEMKSLRELTSQQQNTLEQANIDLTRAKKKEQDNTRRLSSLTKDIERCRNHATSERKKHTSTITSLKKHQQQSDEDIQHLQSQIQNMTQRHEELSKDAQHHHEQKLRDKTQHYESLCEGLQTNLNIRLEELQSARELSDQRLDEMKLSRNRARVAEDELKRRELGWLEEKERLMGDVTALKDRCVVLEQDKQELLSESERLEHRVVEVCDEKDRALELMTQDGNDRLKEMEIKLKLSEKETMDVKELLTRRENEMKKKESQYQRDISMMEDRIEKLQKQLEVSQTSVDVLGKKDENSRKENDDLKKALIMTQNEKEDLLRRIESDGQTAMEDIQMVRDDSEKALEEVKAESEERLNELMIKAHRLENDKISALNEVRETKFELESVKTLIEKSKSQIQSLLNEKQNMEELLQMSEGKRKRLEHEIKKIKDDQKSHESESNEIKVLIRELSEENAALIDKQSSETRLNEKRVEGLTDIIRDQETERVELQRSLEGKEQECVDIANAAERSRDELTIELNITKEALNSEKERRSNDNILHQQNINDAERELEMTMQKHRKTVNALRDDVEKHKSAAKDIEITSDGLKMQLETKTKEIKRMENELGMMKSKCLTLEKRLRMATITTQTNKINSNGGNNTGQVCSGDTPSRPQNKNNCGNNCNNVNSTEDKQQSNSLSLRVEKALRGCTDTRLSPSSSPLSMSPVKSKALRSIQNCDIILSRVSTEDTEKMTTSMRTKHTSDNGFQKKCNKNGAVTDLKRDAMSLSSLPTKVDNGGSCQGDEAQSIISKTMDYLTKRKTNSSFTIQQKQQQQQNHADDAAESIFYHSSHDNNNNKTTTTTSKSKNKQRQRQVKNREDVQSTHCPTHEKREGTTRRRSGKQQQPVVAKEDPDDTIFPPISTQQRILSDD